MRILIVMLLAWSITETALAAAPYCPSDQTRRDCDIAWAAAVGAASLQDDHAGMLSRLDAAGRLKLVRSVEAGLGRVYMRPVRIDSAFVIPRKADYLFCGLTTEGQAFVYDTKSFGPRKIGVTPAAFSLAGCGANPSFELK